MLITATTPDLEGQLNAASFISKMLLFTNTFPQPLEKYVAFSNTLINCLANNSFYQEVRQNIIFATNRLAIALGSIVRLSVEAARVVSTFIRESYSLAFN